MEKLGIIFDLDGTLVNSAPDVISAMNAVLEKNNFSISQYDEAIKWVGYGGLYMLEQYFKNRKIKVDNSTLKSFYYQFLDHYSDHIDEETLLYPNTEEVLDYYLKKNIKMGVCTNKKEDLSIKLLERLNISSYFKAIVGSDTVSKMKPHPSHLVETAKRMGSVFEEILMVGDSKTDYETAKSARASFVLITHGYGSLNPQSTAPDLIIDDFLELKEFTSKHFGV